MRPSAVRLTGLEAGREGVDLDHPAEAVRLVGVDIGVEARVDQMPAIAEAGGRDAITRLAADDVGLLVLEVGADRGAAGGRAEVAVPVLLAGQVGAPGRAAIGAIVQGAQHLGATGVGGRAHQRMSRRRALQRHGRVAMDAAVVGRLLDMRPRPVGGPPDMDHADAMRGLRLARHLQRERREPVGRAGGGGDGVEILGVDVLVVHDQQAFVAAVAERVAGRIEGEEAHAVVVVADLLLLVGGAVAGVGLPGRCRRGERLAPGQEGARQVACRDGDRVGGGRGDAAEADHALGRGLCRRCGLGVVVAAAAGGAGQEGQGGGAQAAQQESPPARLRRQQALDRLGQRGKGGRVGGVVVVAYALRHAGSPVGLCRGSPLTMASDDDAVLKLR
jgi:hypothetical protein